MLLADLRMRTPPPALACATTSPGGGATFSAVNTVHIDDLSRNFAMNPQSGLKCAQYKLHGELAKRGQDTELVPMTQYLLRLATHVADFTTIGARCQHSAPIMPSTDV